MDKRGEESPSDAAKHRVREPSREEFEELIRKSRELIERVDSYLSKDKK